MCSGWKAQQLSEVANEEHINDKKLGTKQWQVHLG